MKRSFDASGQNGYDYVMTKRRGMEMPQGPPPPQNGVQIPPPRVMMQTNIPNGPPVDPNGYPQQHSIVRLIPQHPQMQAQLGPHMRYTLMFHCNIVKS